MFYRMNVDICNTKSMWNFLKDHFTYYTMNSWNLSKSIANNVKLYNLNLEGDWTIALQYICDEIDSGGLQLLIADEIRDFEEHYPCYKVGFNGRSDGYLVLYSNDKNAKAASALPPCVADYDTYNEFKEDVKSGWYGYRVSDFNRELRDAVTVVREFDKLCDRLRDFVNEYSKKSFDVDKLEKAIEIFNDEYFDDLNELNLTGPVMEGDKVRLNDIACYNIFMQCFIKCFGPDYRRIITDSNLKYLWLKES